MTINMKVEFAGIKDALKLVNDIDKSVRQSYTREYQKLMAPVVKMSKEAVPDQAPITGWERSWTTPSGFQALPWNGVVGEKLIKSGVSGRKPKTFQGVTRGLAAFYVRWSGTTAVIFDMAGRKGTPSTDQGRNMVAGLEEKFGPASRIMWPSLLENQEEVTAGMQTLLDRIMQDYERALTRGSVR
jgi:hypothetical protein